MPNRSRRGYALFLWRAMMVAPSRRAPRQDPLAASQRKRLRRRIKKSPRRKRKASKRVETMLKEATPGIAVLECQAAARLGPTKSQLHQLRGRWSCISDAGSGSSSSRRAPRHPMVSNGLLPMGEAKVGVGVLCDLQGADHRAPARPSRYRNWVGTGRLELVRIPRSCRNRREILSGQGLRWEQPPPPALIPCQ